MIGIGRREVRRLQLLLAHLDLQVLHDPGEHGLLVHAYEPGGGVVTQKPDENGDHGGHRREGHA